MSTWHNRCPFIDARIDAGIDAGTPQRPAMVMTQTLWQVGLLLPWVASTLLAVLPKRHDRLAGPWAILAAALLVGALSWGVARDLSPPVPAEIFSVPIASPMGLELLFRRDGLSQLFALVTAGSYFFVTVYAWRYLPHELEEKKSVRKASTFHSLMAAFAGAMLGLVTSENLLGLYVFWELTSLTSFLLIGFFDHQQSARTGAWQALVLTLVGGLCLLASLVLLGVRGESWDFRELLARHGAGEMHALGAPAALMAVAALSKSAQFPFMRWLPAAMAAPAPVSAFLHSAALVAAGVFVLCRFFPLFAEEPAWFWMLAPAAGASVLLAGVWASRQDSVKGLLAYSTISQYAYLFIGLSLGTEAGLGAAIFGLLLHAPIKAGLFLVAGTVTYRTGGDRFSELRGGPRPAGPLVPIAAGLTFALSGAPLAAAFYYKEELLHAAEDAQRWDLIAVLLAGAGLTAAYCLRFFLGIFEQPYHARAIAPRAPLSMLLPVGALALAAVGVGFAPDAPSALVAAAASSALNASVPFETHAQPGALPVASLAAVALGALGYAAVRTRASWRARLERLPENLTLGGARGVRAYTRLSDRTLDLHDGNIRRYLLFILTGAVGLGLPIAITSEHLPVWTLDELDPLLLSALVVTLASAGILVISDYYVVMVIALNLTGFALAVVFLRLQAPNVAIAQVLVETLATLIFVLALRASHHFSPADKARSRRDRYEPLRWPVALLLGAVIGLATFSAAERRSVKSVGRWYAGHGADPSGANDLVAAILADFRALDTIIELLVFTVSMLGVIALYRKHGASA